MFTCATIAKAPAIALKWALKGEENFRANGAGLTHPAPEGENSLHFTLEKMGLF